MIKQVNTHGATHEGKGPYPGLTGVNIHTFTLLRGVLRRRKPRPEPHRLQNEQSPFTRSDTGHPDLLDVGRSYGSITDTFHSRAAPRRELSLSHTRTVTSTIGLPSWHQYGQDLDMKSRYQGSRLRVSSAKSWWFLSYHHKLLSGNIMANNRRRYHL